MTDKEPDRRDPLDEMLSHVSDQFAFKIGPQKKSLFQPKGPGDPVREDIIVRFVPSPICSPPKRDVRLVAAGQEVVDLREPFGWHSSPLGKSSPANRTSRLSTSAS